MLMIHCTDDVKRVLVRWPHPESTPLFRIALWYPNAEEVLLMGWRQHALPPGTTVEELKEVDTAFEWQDGQSMEVTLLKEKKRILSIEIDSMVSFKPVKIARVEVMESITTAEEL
jgi:hypothetical protein